MSHGSHSGCSLEWDLIKSPMHACVVSMTRCILWPLHSNCCHYGLRQKVLSETYIFSHMQNWKLETSSHKLQGFVLASHERPVWWRGGVGERQRFGSRGGHLCAWPKDWKQRPLSFWKNRDVFWSRHKHLASFSRWNQLMRWQRRGKPSWSILARVNYSQEQHTGILPKVLKCGRKSKQCLNSSLFPVINKSAHNSTESSII